MENLNLFDYVVIVAYFLALLGIGTYLKRRAARGIEAYFLGDRKMPWWALGISSMATWFDMTGTMVITSFLFLLGPRALYIEGFRGGACLILVFILLWAGKWHRRSGVITGAEWMIYRFGNDFWGNAARTTQAVSMVIFGIGILAYSFKGAGLFLSMFMPFSPFVCTIILLAITTIYTLEGGFYGVIVTDIFQILCVVIGVVIIVAQAVILSADINLGEMAEKVTGNIEWLSTLPSFKTTMPKGYEQYSFLTFMAIFYLLKTTLQGIGMGADPRYFGARNDRECGLLSFVCGWLMALRWPLMLSFAVLGLFLVNDFFPNQNVLSRAADIIKTRYPATDSQQWPTLVSHISHHPDQCEPSLINELENSLGTQWALKLNLVGYNGTVNPERIVPAVLLFKVPLGARGLLLVALLAAAMSTFNSFINLTSSFIVRDFYQSCFRPDAGNKELVYVSYVSGLLIVIGGVALSYSAQSINDIWGWLMMGLTSGMILPLAVRLYWWRFNGCGFTVGIVMGMAAAITERFLWPEMPEWLQFVMAVCVSTVGCVLGTYATQPTPRTVLNHFYATTRPFGWWKPFSEELSPDIRKAVHKEHFYDIVSIPFVFAWQISILLIPMQLVIGQYDALFWTLPFLVISLIGMYLFWYRQLPAKNETCIKNDMNPKHNRW